MTDRAQGTRVGMAMRRTLLLDVAVETHHHPRVVAWHIRRVRLFPASRPADESVIKTTVFVACLVCGVSTAWQTKANAQVAVEVLVMAGVVRL